MDAGLFGALDSVPGRLDVRLVGAGEGGDGRPLHLVGDGLHALEVAGGANREAGLDNVDAEAGKLQSNLQLLFRTQAHAG